MNRPKGEKSHETYFNATSNSLVHFPIYFRALSPSKIATTFLIDYIGREPEVKTYDGLLILLGSEGDKDAFCAMKKFCELFLNALEPVFIESGGHHFIFFTPREVYSRVIHAIEANRITKSILRNLIKNNKLVEY